MNVRGAPMEGTPRTIGHERTTQPRSSIGT